MMDTVQPDGPARPVATGPTRSATSRQAAGRAGARRARAEEEDGRVGRAHDAGEGT